MIKTKKEELKALKTGDIILLSDGKKAEFLKVKIKKFDCLIEDEVWSYPIEMFDKLIKKAEPNPLLAEVQEIVKKYKG